MGFHHRAAVGFFEPSSLELGATLKVERPLDRAEVEVIARTHLEEPPSSNQRPATWWVGDAYIVVEYITLARREDRVRFIRALMERTGCDAVDVTSDCIVREPSWRSGKKHSGLDPVPERA